ncbi:MAG: dipeptide epimerase [Rhodanobacteraceae bacterium]
MNTVTRSPLSLELNAARLATKAPFRISGYVLDGCDAITVRLREAGMEGRGEAEGVYYHHENARTMIAQIRAVQDEIVHGAGRAQLLELLPAGGARNALDCALWDLEAKRAGKPVWELAGIPKPRPLLTTFTIGAGEPEVMAARAREWSDASELKLKLTGDDADAERVRAVRGARPDAWLMVDANQGFTPDTFHTLLPVLVETRVQLIEQPFPIGREVDMDGLNSPICIAADESIQDHLDLDKVTGRFDLINIKLDKCGGLTEALRTAAEARRRGLGLMVGNMGGTSLAMAPAFMLGQLCDVNDLDGPLQFVNDPPPNVRYTQGQVDCPETVWGAPTST